MLAGERLKLLRGLALERYYANPSLCRHCGSVIEPRIDVHPSVAKRKSFCNHSCAGSFNGANVVHRKRQRYCRICKTSDVKVGSKICAGCKEGRRRGARPTDTLGEINGRPCLAGRHPSWKHAHVRGLARTANQWRPKVCQSCGYSQHVEYAHIRALSQFPLTATIAEVNATDNIVILCRNCHWEFDHGMLDLRAISSSGQERGVSTSEAEGSSPSSPANTAA